MIVIRGKSLNKIHIIWVNDQQVTAEVLVGEDVTFSVISRAPDDEERDEACMALFMTKRTGCGHNETWDRRRVKAIIKYVDQNIILV